MESIVQNLGAFALPAVVILSTYFFILMPQKKREKKNREMLSSIKQGNEIITIGGIIGKIVNIKDNEVTIVTSVENTQLNITKWAIKEIISEKNKK